MSFMSCQLTIAVVTSIVNESNNMGYLTGREVCHDEGAKLQCGVSDEQCGDCG